MVLPYAPNEGMITTDSKVLFIEESDILLGVSWLKT
jgi:hypothetical protein